MALLLVELLVCGAAVVTPSSFLLAVALGFFFATVIHSPSSLCWPTDCFWACLIGPLLSSLTGDILGAVFLSALFCFEFVCFSSAFLEDNVFLFGLCLVGDSFLLPAICFGGELVACFLLEPCCCLTGDVFLESFFAWRLDEEEALPLLPEK